MRNPKGSITPRGTGCWLVQVELGRDEDGKRRRYSKVVRGSKAKAATVLAQMQGAELTPETTWLEFYERVVEPSFDGLQANTIAEYKRLWWVELAPRIGKNKVAEMDWQEANDVLTDIQAPTVQRSAGRLLKKMCNMAIRDRSHLLSVNPVDRAIEYAPHRKRPKELILAEDVGEFMQAIQGMKYEPMLLCMLGAGLRPEEARALLWEDISPFGDGFCAIEINKALTIAASRAVFKETKTEGSTRTAICGAPFSLRLLALSVGQSGPLCPSGRPYNPDKPDDWYTAPNTIAHNWQAWCKRNNVRHVTEENMRSSYASMMGEAMAPDSVVAGNMGHSDGTTKGRHYQRVTLRAKCAAAMLLADLLESVENSTSAVENFELPTDANFSGKIKGQTL